MGYSEIEELALADWRRHVAELYARIRNMPDRHEAWTMWVAARNELFRAHPQSPLDPAARERFEGLHHFEYDPGFRFTCKVEPVAAESYDIGTSDGASMAFARFGRVTFDLPEGSRSLEVYQLVGYGSGVFLPLRDATSGTETYGGGRYLLDTIKGADLGGSGNEIELDFNFAYNPSCSYNSRWVCPLAPRPNHLPVAIPAGEKSPR